MSNYIYYNYKMMTMRRSIIGVLPFHSFKLAAFFLLLFFFLALGGCCWRRWGKEEGKRGDIVVLALCFLAQLIDSRIGHSHVEIFV